MIPRRYGLQFKLKDQRDKVTTKTISGLNLPDDDYDTSKLPSGVSTVEEFRHQIVGEIATTLTDMTTNTLMSATLIRYEEVAV